MLSKNVFPSKNGIVSSHFFASKTIRALFFRKHDLICQHIPLIFIKQFFLFSAFVSRYERL